ncbi:MAG TPA: helix-turn-helix transcriptional regulator [Haloplasmataceae bacterium]
MSKKDKKKYNTDIQRINRLFGERVRQLRIMKGLTQEELGLQCGLHRTYIGQIERAEKNVTLQSIYKIANTLDVEIKELLDIPELYKDQSNKNKKTDDE